LLDLSILPATQANYGVLVYATDFDGPVGAEWSTNTASQTPTGARRFLGEFGNQTVTLGLSNLPPHTAATVVFDQFVLRHWLGNDTHTNDADVFEVNVAGGLKLVNASFNNGPAFGSGQSFPAPYPGATNAPLTGAAETNSLGYTFPGVGPLDSVYAHLYSFPHTAGTLVLNFQARGLASLAEASWGLDDVRVFLTPREGPPRIVPLGFAADGFVLELTVGWGWSYLLQGSENLSDWSNLDTGRAGADPVRITDAEALSKPHRFYRVLQTP
jgi:hypothetical protein